MKRRELLKLGAIATVATQLPLDAGCVVPQAATAPSPAVPSDFLARLDGQLAGVAGADFVQRFIHDQLKTEPTPKQQAMLEDRDAMFRRMLRTLLITQGFRDEAPETQFDPQVQARMFDHMDEVGTTVFAVSDMLAGLSAEHRTKLKHTLKAKPDLPMAIAEAIDGQAARAGVSGKRRLQLRQMMMNATFQMRHGDPNSLIDEYVAKVERVRVSGSTDAKSLDFAQKLGERAFWKYQQQLAQDAGTQPAPPATPAMPGPAPLPAGADPAAVDSALPPPAPMRPPGSVAPMRPMPPPAPPKEKHEGARPGTGAMHAAGYMMGIGVVTFGVSAALVDSSEAFLFGLTVGAVLFAAGLITLIVGAIIYAANDDW
ncbi:MAG: hypothetical protein ABI591_23635 [Kofleriaceae bacterium]